jgi:hypothetical protein
MNSYTVSNLGVVSDEKPIYLQILMFVFVPLVYGSIVDIGFTELVGSQHCSFKDGDTRCTVFGKEIPSIVRSAARGVIQLIIIVSSLILFKKFLPAYSKLVGQSPLGVAGVVLLLLTQSDMMGDFRRLFNEALFKIKYH